MARELPHLDPKLKFNYVRCQDCRGYLLHPTPKNLADYYDEAYPPYQFETETELEKLYWKLERAKLSIVHRFARSGKLIDVGPAAGRFLRLAQQKGFHVSGIERDPSCCQRLRDTLGIEVMQSDTPGAVLSEYAPVDVVTAFHVIEHLLDINAFLKKTVCALRPGGIAVLSMPNPDAISFRLYRRRWVHLQAPFHVQLIPIRALDRIMANLGCVRIYLTFRDAVSQAHNRVHWLIPGFRIARMILGQKRMASWWPRLNRIFGTFMWPIDNLPHQGSCYTVVYRKPE